MEMSEPKTAMGDFTNTNGASNQPFFFGIPLAGYHGNTPVRRRHLPSGLISRTGELFSLIGTEEAMNSIMLG